MNKPNVNNSASSFANDVCLARQAILDRRCNIVAYELQFHDANDWSNEIIDYSEGAIKIIVNAFSTIGAETLLGGKKAFVHLNFSLIESDVITLLPKEKTIIELKTKEKATDKICKKLRSLHGLGYRFSLDGSMQDENYDLLYPFVESLKLDITEYSSEDLIKISEFFNSEKKSLIAKNLESQNDFELAKSIGFKYFQGHFFTKPTVIKQGKIPANKQNIIEIMNAVMDDADTVVIEEKIIRDVSISYKLLKYVNSAGLSRGRELTTIQDTLSMLGRKQLYRWLSILLFAAESEGEKQSNSLFKEAVYRGRLMEMFGENTKHKNPSELFILGTFSYLDVLLERKLSWLLKDMVLPENIKAALLKNEGDYWDYLLLAKNLSDDKHDQNVIDRLGLTLGLVNDSQLKATAYCESFN